MLDTLKNRMGKHLLHHSVSKSAASMVGRDDDIKDECSECSIRQHPRKRNEPLIDLSTQTHHQIGPSENVADLLDRAGVRPPLRAV